MNTKQTITIDIICQQYEIEYSFVEYLNELGLIELVTVGEVVCVEESQIHRIDKVIKLHHELDINPEGIDVILNLLNKIDDLEQSLLSAENRLSVYESLLNHRL